MLIRKRTRPLKQKGLSSIEMVMILPFILVLYLMVANISKFWHVKMDRQIHARTSAWRQSYFASVPCLDVVDKTASSLRNNRVSRALMQNTSEGVRRSLNQTFFGELGHACEGFSRSSRLTQIMNSGDSFGDHKQGLVSQFGNVSIQAHSITGRAYHLWGSWGFNNGSVLFLEESHVLDINGLSHRGDIPKGHDEYLREWLIEKKASASASRNRQDLENLQRQQQSQNSWYQCQNQNEGLAQEDQTDCGEQPLISP